MMRTSLTLMTGFLLAACATGCATGNGTFRADGFHHADYPYTVRYAQPATHAFLSEDWRLDNYLVKSDGSAGDAKTGQGYMSDRVTDLDGDGKAEHDTDVFAFDLKLVNRRSNATIWTVAFPVGPNDAERDLRTFMDQYVEGISGTGFYAVRVASDPATDGRHVEGRSKTYATKVVSSRPLKIGNLDAYEATIELANVDQIKLDPNRREAVAKVVLIKTDYYTTVIAHDVEENAVKTRGIVLAGYSNAPSEFEAQLPDFDRFLSLLEFGPPKN